MAKATASNAEYAPRPIATLLDAMNNATSQRPVLCLLFNVMMMPAAPAARVIAAGMKKTTKAMMFTFVSPKTCFLRIVIVANKGFIPNTRIYAYGDRKVHGPRNRKGA